MVDYEATLQNFFTQTIVYLTRIEGRASAAQRDNIEHAIQVVQKIVANPKAYAAQYVPGGEYTRIGDAFIPAGSHDDSAYLTLTSVVTSMGDLYSTNEVRRVAARRKLLAGVKTMHYKNADGKLKAILYPFMPAERFAVQRKIQKTI